jgi:chromosome segregation ATPase
MANKTKWFVSGIGLLGTVVCAIGVIGVWYVERRVDAIREQMFESVEASFARIDNRVISVEQLLADSRITIEKFQQDLKDRALDKTGENLKARFQLETRAEQLTGGLDKAETLLNASNATVEHVAQLLQLGELAGLPLNQQLLDPVSEQIVLLQTRVAAAKQTADNLQRQVVSVENEDASSPTRVQQIRKLAVTLLATFSQLDQRVSDFAAQINETRDAATRMNTKIRSRLVSAAVVATLFLLWMAAGQICLWRRIPSPANSAC